MIRSPCQMDKGEQTGEVSGACELLKSVPAVKVFDRLDGVGLLFFGEFGVDREGEHFLGRALGDREGSFLVAQIAVATLQVQGDGIVNLGAGADTRCRYKPVPADTNRCQA